MNKLAMFSKNKIWQVISIPTVPAVALSFALAPSAALAGSEKMKDHSSKAPGEYQAMDQQPLSNNGTSKGRPEFSQVDTNNDQKLEWVEIYSIYDDEVHHAGWTEESVLNAYDSNNNQSLDNAEYDLFVTSLIAVPASQFDDDRRGSSMDASSSIDDPEMSRSLEKNQMSSSMNGSTDSSMDRTQSADGEPRVSGIQQMNPNDQQAGPDNQPVSSSDQRSDSVNESTDRQVSTSNTMNSELQNSTKSTSADDASATVISITTVTQIPTEELEDMEVINMRGESIGEVEDVITESDGSISALIVGVGGFWDIGDKDVRVEAEDLSISGEYIVWETTLNEEQLDDLPQYDGDELSSVL